jgi:hypothetical protein
MSWELIVVIAGAITAFVCWWLIYREGAKPS